MDRRPYRRRNKDILALTLKSLAPNEEILCTENTYRNIRERVDEITAYYSDRIFRTSNWFGVQKVKRIA